MSDFSSWNKRIEFTINSSLVTADLTDKDLSIDLSLIPEPYRTQFFNTIKSDGGDIRIAKADGTPFGVETELPVKVVFIDTGTETGKLYFQYSSTLSSTVDTVFRIYFDNPAANLYARNDTYGSENVWDSNYVAVWLLEEDVNTTAGGYVDETSNQNNGTGISMALPKVENTVIKGFSQDFDGSADRISIPASPSVNINTDISIEFWLNSDVANDGQVLGAYENGGGFPGYGVSFGVSAIGTSRLGFWNGSSWVGANTNNVAGSWQHFAVTNDNTNTRHYRNGVADGSGAHTNPVIYTGSKSIGATSSGSGRYINARLDEMKISNIARSSDWFQTGYNNQTNQAGFFTIGAIQENVPNAATISNINSITGINSITF